MFQIPWNTDEQLLQWEDKNIQEIKKQQDSQKINILLVWRGGGYHDAPDLTDTIILASLDKKKHLISMLSLPRDLYVEYDEIEFFIFDQFEPPICCLSYIGWIL